MDKLVDFTQRQLTQVSSIIRTQPKLSIMLAMLVLAIAVLMGVKIHILSTTTALSDATLETPIAAPAAQPPIIAQPDDALTKQSDVTAHKITIGKGDSLATIFQQLKLSSAQLVAINSLGTAIKPLRQLHPGQTLTIDIDGNQQLASLSLNIDATQKLTINRTENGFDTKIEALPLEAKLNFVHGTVEQSYYQAAHGAGLTNQQIHQLSQIFKDKINFHHLQQGDHFSALYEGYYSEGKLTKKGNIVAAEFTHNNTTYKAVRFTYPKDHTGYYTPKGKSYQIAISRAPVKYSHISSYFGKRYHPILHFMRPHEGVDYAAPSGTAIHAAGDGVITYLGRKGGYGRVIFIQHNNKYSTRYAHMQAYAKGLKRGSQVKKGQIIGYVGMSGLATGPHLHFEIRVNGVAKNPLKVALPDAQPVPKAYAAEFQNRANQLMNVLATHTESLNIHA